MGFKNFFKKAAVATARIIAPIGETIGNAMALPTASKLEDERAKQEMDLHNALIEQIRTTKEPAKKEQLKKIATRSISNDSKSIYDSVEGFKETPLQSLAKFGITASNVALFTKLPTQLAALKAKPVVDFIAGANGVKKVSTGAKILQGTKIVAQDFGIGAGFGTLFAMERGEREPEKIAKEALKFGALSAVAPPVIGKTFGASRFLVSKTAGAIGKGLEKGISKLEVMAERPFVKPQNSLDEFINVAHGTKYSPIMKRAAGKLSEIGRELQGIPGKLKTALIDRMSPIRDISKQVSEITGKPVSFIDDPYQQVMRTQGVIDGKFKNEATDLFTSVVNDFKDVELEAQGYLAAKNALDRLNLGQPVVKGLTKEQALEAIALAEKSPAFGKIQAYEQNIQKIRDRLIDIRLESGLLDEVSAAKLRETHPNYLPNKVLDFFDEGGASLGDLINPGGQKLSVTESGIKAAKGSERELMNPVESMIVELKKAITDAERNNVANKIIGVVDNNNATEQIGFQRIVEGMEVPKEVDLKKQGLEKVSRYVNGVREDWLVPEDIGRAMKNMDVQEIGLIGRIFSIPSQILKAGATRFNPDFIFRNPARDIQTAQVTSPAGLSGTDWIKILLQSNGKNAGLLKAAEEEGALLSGLIQQQKTPRAILESLEKGITIKKAVKEYNPLSIIEKVGEKLENNTRLAVFQTGLKAGQSPAEAAFNARNASIDFNKMGNTTAFLNKFIPFLNARIQGFVNLGGAISRDPTKFVRDQMWTSVYPTMLLNSYNNKFESYKNMPQRQKDKHWIIMIGERDGIDEGGNPIKIPDAIRIPKGESQQAVSNTIDNFLEYSKDRDYRTYEELTKDLAAGISPISGASSLGPLTTPLELTANFDFFREKAIVPDYITVGGKSFASEDLEPKYQYTNYSSETAKKIGNHFNISPAKVDFVNGKIFGGLGPTIFKSLDIIRGGYEPRGIGAKEGEELTTFEKLAQTPVFKGFLTTSNYGAFVKDLELANEITKDLENPEFVKRQQAELIWKTLNKMDKKDAAAKWEEMTKENPKMIGRLKDIIEDEKQGLNSTERLMKKMEVGNGARALFIAEQFNMLEEKEQKAALWNQLVEKKIITKEISQQLKLLMESGKLKTMEEDSEPEVRESKSSEGDKLNLEINNGDTGEQKLVKVLNKLKETPLLNLPSKITEKVIDPIVDKFITPLFDKFTKGKKKDNLARVFRQNVPMVAKQKLNPEQQKKVKELLDLRSEVTLSVLNEGEKREDINLPLMESAEEKNTKRRTLDHFDWTDDAVKKVLEAKIKDMSPKFNKDITEMRKRLKYKSDADNVGGVYFGNSDVIENYTIDQAPMVTAHEMLHLMDKRSAEEMKEFNEAWEEYKKGPVIAENKKEVIAKMDEIDRTLKKGYDSSERTKAVERFAFLGSTVYDKRWEYNRPKELDKYFKGIFNLK